MSLRTEEGKLFWVKAGFLQLKADMYRKAATAAEEIEEEEIAAKWVAEANNLENQAARLFEDAKKYGYFGEKK